MNETSGGPGRNAGGDAGREDAAGDSPRTTQARAEVLPRMGGIALRNGLVLVSEDHWAAAIREPGGGIAVASGRKPKLPAGGGSRARVRPIGRAGVAGAPGAAAGAAAHGSATAGPRPAAGSGPAPRPQAAPAPQVVPKPQVADFQGLPMLRGLARFAETLLVLGQVKLRMPRAEMPLEGGRVAAALAAAYAATSAVRTLGPKSVVAQETGAALAAFIPAVLSLKDSTISGYHGAEHKVIAGREAELIAALTGRAQTGSSGPASAASCAPKEHERCGSNLVGPLLISTIAANALIRGRSRRMTPAGSAVAGAVSLGAALEAFRWATRHGDNLAARLLLSPGRLLQKTLTTSEPTPEQLEVAERAMEELLRLEAAQA